MSHDLYTRTLRDNRRVLLAWTAATAALATMYSAFYPQISADSMAGVPEAMRGFGLDDASSAAGYLQGPVFGLLVPLLVTFYGAATGARMTSGDEETGYLDLLLAHPIGRTRLVFQRFAALVTGALGIAVVVLLALLAIRGAAGLGGIGIGQLAAQCLQVALLGITFGAVATALGAVTGRSRAVVFGTTAGLGVLTYALNGFALQLGADRLRFLTPYHYYIGAEPLKNGLALADTGVLLAVTAILIGAGVWRFGRRDIAA